MKEGSSDLCWSWGYYCKSLNMRELPDARQQSVSKLQSKSYFAIFFCQYKDVALERTVRLDRDPGCGESCNYNGRHGGQKHLSQFELRYD